MGGTVSAVGRYVTDGVLYVGGLASLFFEAVSWIFKPHVKHRQLISHMLQIGVRTLPVSGVILFLIGMVIAFQTAYQVRALGGEVLIPALLSVSIARELGPVMTALVVAGRVGAAITAEIGTMAVTEQIDAIDSMSVPPVKYLVAPRLIAMALVAPILTIYTNLIGLLGGYVACVGKLGLSHQYYFDKAFGALSMEDIGSGLWKSFIFAIIICIVSCFEGMRVKGGAQGVGRATMQSVVVSFIGIVVADFVFTLFFYLT